MIGNLIQPEFEDMIGRQAWGELRESIMALEPADAADLITDLPTETKGIVFRVLSKEHAAAVFSYLPLERQEQLIRSLSGDQVRRLLDQMTPDDRARLVEELPAAVTRQLLDSLSPDELKATRDLLGYPPDTAGRYMTPEYVALPKDMTAREALEFVRLRGRGKETIATMYVVDENGTLLEDVRLSALVLADPSTMVSDVEERPLVSIPVSATRDEIVAAFDRYDRVTLPVVDAEGRMLGIITVDDVLDAAQRTATEDIHRIGGSKALEAPYLVTGFRSMLRTRGGWLSVLFLGEMLTASAMGYFEKELEQAVVLALFVPLIISSGGNSGSQAATIIIRALALREMGLRDWWRVMRREIVSGLTLGAWLGGIGFLRITIWQQFGWADYTSHWVLVAFTVWVSLIGVVMFGTLAGSMLPFLLRRLGFDPASSSAPFVATLVDVTGLVIYFTVAMVILRGTLL
ncbi:MAG: magnesium transporter [Leptolyngbya sp. PLA3]|nr:MAG: magnesium transporter [Cyanobacteria bacterium CYA]MCE7967492.1 magnesium transporter [Leptolyngbya sp. PL-A3]